MKKHPLYLHAEEMAKAYLDANKDEVIKYPATYFKKVEELLKTAGLFFTDSEENV